jgi:hypothetical protein
LGTNSCYEKPEKEYKLEYFKTLSTNKVTNELFIKQKLQE